MKRSVRILCVVLSIILTINTGLPVSAAENSVPSKDIKISDLFYGYSYYLAPKFVDGTDEQWKTDRYLKKAIETGTDAMSKAADGLGDIISAAIFSFSNGDYLFSEFMAALGLGDSLNDKCVDKATRLLLIAAMQNEDFVSSLVQGSEKIKNGWEAIQNGTDLLEGTLLDVNKTEKIEDALDAKSDLFDAVDGVITVAEMGSYICFIEAVNDEVLDYLIDTIEQEELKDSLTKHKNYKEAHYVNYIIETYLTNAIVEGVADIGKDLIGGSYLIIAEFIFKVCATIAKEITGLGSAEEVLVATKLVDYINCLEAEKSELLAHFGSAPVLPDDVKKYEYCYNMYIAAVKAYVSAAKEVYADYEDKLDDELTTLKEKVSYENHLSDCKKVVNSIPAEERRLMVNTEDELYYKLEEVTYISAPSDTMEEQTIYLCNDRLYYGIETYADVYFPLSEEKMYCIVEGDFKAESSNIVIPKNVCVMVEDYLGTYLDLRDEKTIQISGTLVVNGRFEDEYLSETHVELSEADASLQLNGDVIINGTWKIPKGEVIFRGSTVSAPRLSAIGENATVKLKGEDIQNLELATFTVERVYGYTDKADITLTGIANTGNDSGENTGYMLGGSAKGYMVGSTGTLLVSENFEGYGLTMQETTLDVRGNVEVENASFQDMLINIYGIMDIADSFTGTGKSLKTYNTVNVYGSLVINGSFKDEISANTTLQPIDKGMVIFQGTGAGTIAPKMFELERKTGYSPNLILKANDEGFFLEKADASAEASATELRIMDSIVLEEGSYAFDNTCIESSGALVVDNPIELQGNLENLGTLEMTSGMSLCVEGDFTVGSAIDHSELLTAGVLEVKGDFTQNGTVYKNYNTNGTHTTRLSGTAPQNVKFYYYQQNSLKHLEITNSSSMGVIFKSHITMSGLFEHNQKAFTLYSEGSRSTFKDYDGDGVSDPADPYPAVAEVSEYLLVADEIPAQIYEGVAVEPVVVVRDGIGKELELGKDYSLTYSNNEEQGTGKVKITGLGKYAGKSETLSFEIICEHIHMMKAVGEKAATCVSEGNIAYYICEGCGKYYSDVNGEVELAKADVVTGRLDHTLEWIVDLEPTEAAEGFKHQKCSFCDYVCSENTVIEKLPHVHVMKAVGEKAATCVSEGNIAYYICEGCGKWYSDANGERELGKTDVVIGKLEHSYVSKTQDATTSKNGFVITYCKNCGVQKSKTTIYRVKTLKLSTTSYTYNGKAKKPSVVVIDSKGRVLGGKYYKVSYSSGRKEVGTYTVTVKLKNGYKGTLKKTFTIQPKSTKIVKLTTGSKKLAVTWKKQTTQTTGYEIQYSTSKKFTKSTTKKVVVSKSKTTQKTIKSLKANKKYYVRIRTYKTVKGKKIYSDWSAVKSIKIKK